MKTIKIEDKKIRKSIIKLVLQLNGNNLTIRELSFRNGEIEQELKEIVNNNYPEIKGHGFEINPSEGTLIYKDNHAEEQEANGYDNDGNPIKYGYKG
ncbi:MAG: hypothetical protein PHP92_03790 [Candidatus Nanoarchaeia archaeon]|nr:hypothetical protein [Candidatus Nanoarchaeia archaeon]